MIMPRLNGLVADNINVCYKKHYALAHVPEVVCIFSFLHMYHLSHMMYVYMP